MNKSIHVNWNEILVKLDKDHSFWDVLEPAERIELRQIVPFLVPETVRKEMGYGG